MAYCSIKSNEINDLSQEILGQIDDFLGAYKQDSLNYLESQYGYDGVCSILEKAEKTLREGNEESKANQLKVIRINLYDILFKSPERVIPELNFNSKEANTSLITINKEKTVRGKKIKVEESIVSADISQYLSTTLRQQLTRLSIIDLNSETPRLIRTDSDLTESIKSWRASLVTILEKYLENKGLIPVHKVDMTPEEQSDYEKLLMINVWRELQKELAKTSDYKFVAAQDSVGIEKVINPIMALAVLNNFDTVIDSMSSNSIVINPKFKHKSQIYSNKYSFSKQSIQNSSFEGDFSDAAYTRILSNTLKRIFETIPNGHGGYCNIHDLNAIVKHIQTIANLQEDGFESINLKYLFSNESTPKQKFQALLNILTNSDWNDETEEISIRNSRSSSSEFQKRYKDPMKLGSIAKYLIQIYNAFNNSNSIDTNTIEDEKQLSVQLNIIDQLTSMIKNAQNLAYFRVTENGFDVNSASGIRKNKTVSRYKLEDSLQRNIFETGKVPQIYNAQYIIPGSSDTALTYRNIFGREYLDHIRQLTGIDLETPILKAFMQEHPIACANIIGRFLDTYKKLVTSHFKGKKFPSLKEFEACRKEMFEKLFNTPEYASAYVEFTDLVSIENAQDDSMLYDQNLHAQPTQGTPTTIGKWVQNKQTWNKQRENILNEVEEEVEDCNIFIKYDGLRRNVSGTGYNKNLLDDIYVFRQDALVGSEQYKSVISAYGMTSKETMTQAFNYEFLQPLLTQGTMYSQIDCVSDKVRIPLGAMNANLEIEVLGKNGKATTKKFKNLTTNELLQIYHDQHRSYYKVIELKLINDYNRLFAALNRSGDFSTLDKCITQLENLTESDLYKAVKTIFKNGEYIELKPEIHFSGSGPDGKLRFNNTLYYHIASANDKTLFDEIVKSGIEETKKKFKEARIPLKLKITKYTGAQLAEFLGLKDENKDWKSICESYIKAASEPKSLYVPKLKNELSDDYETIFNRLIEKFTIMQNLSAEADLQLSGKLEWIHNGKNKQFKISEINLFNLDLFHKDQSARLVVSKKRYNSLVATFEPVTPGGKFAVGVTQRIAHVQPHVLKLYNYNGDPEHKQDTNDGAIFGNGIFDIIESWSYPGKVYSVGSQKLIGIIPGYDTVTQIKTAKYSINNERIRNGFRHADLMGDGNRYDLELAFKKMNRFALDQNWAKQWSDVKKQTSKNKIWYSFNGVNAYFNEPELHVEEIEGQTIITPTWTNIDGNNIDLETVSQCLGLELVNGGFIINTVYDLWKLFGAQDSCSRNETTGELIPSEASMEMSALLICEYSPEVKTKMIAKLIDINSAKSGQVNVNTKKDVIESDDDLLYQEVESDRFGIQQDYTHEMVDSDIPLLTQALAGAALNGKNPEIAQIIYDQLADIVDDSIQSVEKYFGSEDQKRKFKTKLVEELARSLKTSSASTTADDIVKETLENIRAWEKAQQEGDDSVEYKSLPFSDRNVFSKVTSDMLVALNASGIRQRFEGIAVIQNPSHGVIGIYEDKNGETYTRQDILDIANKYGFSGTNNQKIDQVLNDSGLGFGQEPITNIAQVTIGDVVMTSDPKNPGQTKRYIIESPLKLWELENKLQNGFEVLIDRSTKRDLRTRQISFKVGEEIKNLWSLRSTIYRILLSSKTITLADVAKVNPEAAKEFEDFEINETQSLAYMRANYVGLASAEPYYYPTYADFLKGKDGQVTVTDVQCRSGEQIIPNVNRDRQGIHHSLYRVKNSKRIVKNKKIGFDEIHHTYFEDVIKTELLKVNKFLVDESGKLPLSKNEFQATLTTNNSEIVITNHELPYGVKVDAIEQDGKYYIPDDQGNPLFQVKQGKYAIQTEGLENGKKLYAIQIIGESDNKLEEETKKANFLIGHVENVNLYYNDWNFPQVTYRNKLNGISFDPVNQELTNWNGVNEYNPNKLSELDKYIRSEAEARYNSFLMTLNTISTRIPSQSWQSFLATTTVAFTENDSNDGYMNIWEMWMQGSDFDIDKAYTMMYAIDEHGKVAGNGLIDYSSVESIANSLNQELVKPVRDVQFQPQFATDGKINPIVTDAENDGQLTVWNPDETIVVDGKVLTIGEVDEKKYLSKTVNGKTQLYLDPESNHRPSIDEYLRDHPEKKIDVYNAILEKARGIKGVIAVNTSAWSRFIEYKNENKTIYVQYKWMLDLSRYNRSKIVTYKQNRIMQRMWEVTSGVANLEAATKPMDSALVNDQMDEINEANGVQKKIYNGYCPVTKYEIQEENSVGKENVGINANGIKALAGLEQYFNMKSLKGETVFTPNVKLTFKTSKDKGSRKIGTFHLTKVANTITDEISFVDHLKSIYGEDLSGIIENPLLKGARIVNEYLNTGDMQIARENPEFFTFNENGAPIALPIYNKILTAIDLFKITREDLKFKSRTEQAALFLYYFTQFEDNAADILSVFISLSTDNAKELRLAMMNATPELMSIPIALVTYGMDLRSVLDLCMNTLKPIVDVMSVNRFTSTSKKLTVSEAITKCKERQLLDAETCNSLQSVVALTSELRYLTSMYKINQGAATNLIELQRWIGNLKNVKTEREQSKVILSSGISIESLINEAQQFKRTGKKGRYYEELVKRCTLTQIITLDSEDRLKKALDVAFDSSGNSLAIDFTKLFRQNDPSAEEYRKAMVDYFNIISIGHNVIDVVLNSASFRSQLSATMRQLDVFNSMICTSAISQALINRDIKKQKDQFKSLTSKESDNRVKLLFGHLSVGEFVKRLKSFTFVKSDIDAAFQSYVNIQGDPESSFDLSTNVGIKNFMQVVHDQVIPYLKQTYGDNFFIRSLTDKINRNSETIYTTLPFNAFAKSDQQIEKSNIAEAKIAFSRIMKYNSGLKNKYGKDISIGEIFYVYNMIATAGSMNAMKTCVEQIGTYSNLPGQYEDLVREFDAATELVNGDLEISENELINSSTLDKLELINQALGGNYVVTSKDGSESLSLKKNWIYTLVNPTKTIDITTIENELKEEFPSIESIRFNNLNEDTTRTSVNYTVTFKYTFGVPDSENKQEILDSVSGVIYSDKGKVNSNELESLRYIIRSKIKYAEDFIDTDFSGNVVELTNFKNEIKDYLKIESSSRLGDIILDSLPDDLRIKVITGKVQSDEEIIPHILRMNNEICLILPYTDNFDMNSPEFINCLLSLKSESTSQVANLIELMKLTLDSKKYPNIGKHNYKAYLRKIIEDNDSIEMYKLIHPYINWVIEEATNPAFKQQARTQLELFESVFNENTREFYFEYVGEDPKKSTPLQIGDIFDINGEKYLYTCRSTSGIYILAPLTNPDADIITSLVNPEDIYVKEYSKKRSPNIILGKVDKIQFKYNPTLDPEVKSFETIGIGDLLIATGTEYIVSDVVINRFGKKELIAHETNGDRFILINEEDYYQGVESTQTALINQTNTNNRVINTFDGFEIPIEFLESLNTNDSISTLTIKDAIFQKLLSRTTDSGETEYIILAYKDGNSIQIKLNEIESITSHQNIFDDQFNMLAKPLTVYAKQDTNDEKLYKSLYKGINLESTEDDWNIPELIDVATGQEKGGYKKLIGYNSITGNQAYTLTGYYKTSDLDYDVDDIVEINDNGITKLMKIKAINGDVFGLVQESRTDYQTYKTITPQDIKAVYKSIPKTGKLTDRYRIPESSDSKLSDYHKGKRVLNVLSERYGMDITIENVPESDPNSTHFAFVRDGKIIINTSKFNDYNRKLRESNNKEISLEEYIMLKGLHEFTHLVIAGIQARDGNNYYQLINYVKQVMSSKSADSTILDEIKKGGYIYGAQENGIFDAQAQEYLVRVIEKTFRENSESILNIPTSNNIIEGIKSIMNQGFKQFVNGATRNLSHSINSQLKDVFIDFQRDVFGYATEDMNLEFIRHNYLESRYVDKIKCF